MLPEITHVIASLLANPPQGRRTITVRQAVTAALALPPRSYGLSTEYALRRYRAIKRGSLRLADTLNAALWKELVVRVDARLVLHPQEDDFQALDYILSYEAPSRYFLTPVYAEKLFYRTRRLRKANRRRPLRSFPKSQNPPKSTVNA